MLGGMFTCWRDILHCSGRIVLCIGEVLMNDRVTGNCVVEHRNASWSSSLMPVDCVWACRKAKFLDGRNDGEGHVVVERL